MAVGDVGEQGFGEVGVDMEPAFLELAEALKWPHFGHTYSNSKEKRSVRITEMDGNAKYKSRRYPDKE
jgi:hypothetical protein